VRLCQWIVGLYWIRCVAFVALWSLPFSAVAAVVPCRIEVVEQGTGWPVPLVELKTTHHVAFYTDNAGVVAVGTPELLGREVFFHVSADGYEVSARGWIGGWDKVAPSENENSI
jgi:hypothetical protein